MRRLPNLSKTGDSYMTQATYHYNDDYYCREMGKKGEAWVTSALHSIGLTAKHRDFDLSDSHSGTDVTAQYNGVIATIEVKNLAWNPKHKCSYHWTLTKIVDRFNMTDGLTHILAISYLDMLSQHAINLLTSLNIHITQIGFQVRTGLDWSTTIGKQLRTNIATTIKSLLTNQPRIIDIENTTQNTTDYPYTASLEVVYEPLRGVTSNKFDMEEAIT